MTVPATPFLLTHLLERAADERPDAIAVECGDLSLTYGRLADRAARLAGALADRGAGRGDRVGVHLRKSVDSFVAVHGVLRSGAAYVPIDPFAPDDAVRVVCADAEIDVVIADDHTARRSHGVTTVIGSDQGNDGGRAMTWDEVETFDPAPISRGLADDPAYLMYTSGSTGRPKGIVHTHRSGRRYAELAAECYGLCSDDRMANVAPLHFDQSTFELFAAPLARAAVVVVDEASLRLPASLAALVAERDVTVWYSVPTILIQLLERGGLADHDLSCLRWVLFGGEVFPPAALRRLMTLAPWCRFSNVYGPAEVNQCMFHHLDEPPNDDDPVPIGRAWADTEIRIVDDVGADVDDDAVGELFVRTATMMDGYWRRPQLTAAAIEEPTGPGEGGRWYRTGDLARRRSDGLIDFCGRRDRQVKLRGNRVELDAVEVALGSIHGVERGAAVVMDDPASESILVAAVLADERFDELSARRHVAAKLPPYAVPQRIVAVDVLPLTVTGKVDGRAVAQMLEQELNP